MTNTPEARNELQQIAEELEEAGGKAWIWAADAIRPQNASVEGTGKARGEKARAEPAEKYLAVKRWAEETSRRNDRRTQRRSMRRIEQRLAVLAAEFPSPPPEAAEAVEAFNRLVRQLEETRYQRRAKE